MRAARAGAEHVNDKSGSSTKSSLARPFAVEPPTLAREREGEQEESGSPAHPLNELVLLVSVEGGNDMKKKAATKKSARGVRNLSTKTLTAKQARGVKGGGSTGSKLPGRLKWEAVTLKRGLSNG